MGDASGFSQTAGIPVRGGDLREAQALGVSVAGPDRQLAGLLISTDDVVNGPVMPAVVWSRDLIADPGFRREVAARLRSGQRGLVISMRGIILSQELQRLPALASDRGRLGSGASLSAQRQRLSVRIGGPAVGEQLPGAIPGADEISDRLARVPRTAPVVGQKVHDLIDTLASSLLYPLCHLGAGGTSDGTRQAGIGHLACQRVFKDELAISSQRR